MKNDSTEKKNAKKTGFFSKIGGFFKKIGTFFKEVFSETKKLTWPTKKEVINYTIAVIAFVALMALIMWLLDLAFSNGVNALAGIKIGQPSTVVTTVAP
ncbi:MAG: preprotein translocase subunit SecE [Clostridia bacterium]|nr:preprotein translocase subunit SecE [Clostridia bacterium]